VEISQRQPCENAARQFFVRRPGAGIFQNAESMRSLVMKIPLRALIVEDSEFDAAMLINVLRQGGYDPQFRRVETRDAMLEALAAQEWDIVLSDFNMPRFSMQEALEVLRQSGLDLPFIIVSGGIGEDIAVAAMKAGAHDYLMKGNLARLVPAVTRELREAESRSARRQAETALRESELRYRLLWETSTDAVILVDSNSQIHFTNPAVETVFGYSSTELVGKNLSILQPEELRGQHTQGMQNYMLHGDPKVKHAPRETVGLHKNGRHIAIEIAFSEMQLHGNRWLVAFIRDITARKKAENELRDNQEQFRVAREIQQRLFPKSAPATPGLDLAGASYPAEATGGDYFDFLTMPDGALGVVVADVTGHGIGPAMLMAETRAYLRLLTRNRTDLGIIMDRANQMLAEDVSYERFVTMILTKFDPKSRSLTYASAGHPPGYVLNAAGELKCLLKRTGGPLGIQPDAKYTESSPMQLAPGDVILLLTDGVDESMSPAGEFFGLDRILGAVRPHLNRPAVEIVDALYQAVRIFSENTQQLDDVTAAVIKVV
jgi:PAS domain S-box-containing protein